ISIHVALYHKTHYTYSQPVGHGPHVVRLRPAPHCRTRIQSYSQRITGGEHYINWQQDPFSNWNAQRWTPVVVSSDTPRQSFTTLCQMVLFSVWIFFRRSLMTCSSLLPEGVFTQ